MRSFLRSWIALALAIVVSPALGQTYPNKPIFLIVPFTTGGIADTVARPIAKAMSDALGQAVAVVNKPGVGGALGYAYVANAAPDGYTLLLGLPTLSSIPAANKVNGQTPSYSTGQLEAIARITADPMVFFVRGDSKWKTLNDFIADAKAKPGTLSFSSSGIYGLSHMAAEILSRAAEMKLLHVPYKGGGELILAVLSGQTNGGFQSFGTLSSHIRSGKLRALVVQSAGERVKGFPDVPSAKELGINNAAYYAWTGIFAPVGVPDDVKKKLRDSISSATKDAATLSILSGAGNTVQYLDAPEFDRFWREDEKHQVEVVTKLGKM